MAEQETLSQLPNSNLSVLLAAEVAKLNAGTVHLFTVALAPTPATTHAEFVAAEASFPGYSATVPVFLDPFVTSDGTIETEAPGILFQTTTAVTTDVIAGAWIEGVGPGLVTLSYVVFDTPIPIVLPNQAILMDWFMTTPGIGTVDVEF